MRCCHQEDTFTEKRGPRGPRGYEGPVGPVGPTGESGERVYGYFVSLSSPYSSDGFDMYKFKDQGTGTTDSNYTPGLDLINVTGTYNGSIVEVSNPGNYKVSYNIYLNPHGASGDDPSPVDRRYVVKVPIIIPTPPSIDEVYDHSFDYFSIALPRPQPPFHYGSTITLVGEFIHSYLGGEKIGLTIACDDDPVVTFSVISATLIIEKLSN